MVFIRNAKALGFSLAEIKELLAIADGEVVKCREVRQIARARLAQIEDHLNLLTRLKSALAKRIEQCKRSGSITNCPIIESLSRTEE